MLSESASRAVLVETVRIAAQLQGAQVVDVVVPTPANPHPVPIRSTGASQAIAGNRAAIAALAAADLVLDCTVEGLLHAPELGAILAGGARVLMLSNEHPENFERYAFDPDLARRVELGAGVAGEPRREMRVTSDAGTDLTVRLADARRRRLDRSRDRARLDRALAGRPGGGVPRRARRERRAWCWRRATSTSRSSATSSIPCTCGSRTTTWSRSRGDGVDARLFRVVPGGVRRPRGARHEPRRLGHEPGRALGLRRRCTTRATSTAPRRGCAPATSCTPPAPTSTRAGSRPGTSTCRCSATRSRWTGASVVDAGELAAELRPVSG